jgi:hypothetical protein
LRTVSLAAALSALAILIPGTLAGADSFTSPVTTTIHIAQVARLHRPLRITVDVRADPQELNTGGGAVRAQVKLTSGECGGTFQTTPGSVLLDRRLRPQPGAGAYSGSASGAGRPGAYGIQTVCAFLDNDYQQLADDTTDPPQVNVSRACTTAAARYDRAQRSRRARRPRHAGRPRDAGRSRQHNLTRLRQAARRACGSGVPL